MVLAYQAVLFHTGVNGMWTPISALLLALVAITTAFKKPVLTYANLNILDLTVIFFIVMDIMVQIARQIRPQDALLFGTLNTPMVPAYQVALTLIEMNGMTDLTSVILLALKDTLTL